MHKSKKVLFENTFFLYVLLASKYVFQLISLAYLTRTLGQERYGTLVFTTAFMAYFQLIIDFGFLLSATKEISVQREDKQKVRQILGSTIAAKGMLSLAGLAVLLITIVFVPRIRQDAGFILLSYLVPVLSIALPDYLFRGLEEMRVITVRVVISQGISTALLVVFIHSSDDYMLYPLLMVFGNAFAALWTWYHMTRRLKITPVFMGISYYIRALKDSAEFFMSRMATSLFGPSNVFLLGFKVGNVDLGLFGAANNLINAAKGMYSPISDSLFPYMVVKKNYKLVKGLVLVLTPLVLLGAGFCFWQSEWIITLISGKAYIRAVPYFRILLLSLVLAFYSVILGFPTLGAMGKMKAANLSIIIAAIFHFTAMLIMFATDTLTITNTCWLTCITEALLVILRTVSIFWPSGVKGPIKDGGVSE